MPDGHVLPHRVGNPSLMDAFSFFPPLQFPPLRLLGAAGLSDAFLRAGLPPRIRAGWAGSARFGSLAYWCLPGMCSSARRALSSSVGSEPSAPQLRIYSAWMKTHSSYFRVPVTYEFIYPVCFMPFPFQRLGSEVPCTNSIKSMKKLSLSAAWSCKSEV